MNSSVCKQGQWDPVLYEKFSGLYAGNKKCPQLAELTSTRTDNESTNLRQINNFSSNKFQFASTFFFFFKGNHDLVHYMQVNTFGDDNYRSFWSGTRDLRPPKTKEFFLKNLHQLVCFCLVQNQIVQIAIDVFEIVT